MDDIALTPQASDAVRHAEGYSQAIGCLAEAICYELAALRQAIETSGDRRDR